MNKDLMNAEINQLTETFREEAFEVLLGLETSLLELERYPENPEVVSAIFRALHTIKGSGAMVGFDEVSQFAHQIETVYDLVRSGEITATKPLIDITLSACDVIRMMVESSQTGDRRGNNQANQLAASFSKFLSEPGVRQEVTTVTSDRCEDSPQLDVKEIKITYRIRFRPAPGILLTGTNPILLLNELRKLGECKVIAHVDEIPELPSLNPEFCYTYWDMTLTTGLGIDAIRDVFLFVEDESEVKIDVIDEGESALDDAEYKRLGEILIEKREISREGIERVVRDRKRIGELLVNEGLVQPVSIQAALTEQEQVRQIRESRLRNELISNVRVASDKLDKLVNLVGELVTVQARLSQTSSQRNDPDLLSIAEEVERLTNEIRDRTMSMRMLPMGTTFSKFRRLVRDLSREMGKEVDMITSGEETELDKTVMEKLNDPLVHLIRNSIDHGIEMPEVRRKAGKPEKGGIHLSAEHSGAHVLIQIRDDGAGLDKEAICARAVEKGMITPDADLSEKEIFSLVLAPGFTTSRNVTNISGRGVGLDVVKSAVDTLGGSMEVNSRKGDGMTVILSLPLTLAIIQGLLVRIAQEYFVLPLSVVEECVELTRKDIERAHGRHVANIRGEMVPYIRLREQFMIKGEAAAIEQIVIVKNDALRVGFVVDSVVGEYQTVIKSLGTMFRDVRGISGATILGDGTVALILDTAKLVKLVEAEEVGRQTA